MKTLTLLPMIALAMLLYALPVDAEATRLLNFQGMLTDAGGEPLPDGDYQITFTLYDALEDGQIIYQSDIDVHQEEGVFSAVVGLVDALNPVIFDQDLYLGMKLAGDDEMVPRIQLTATPYAMRASSVDAEVIGPQAIADGTVVRALNGLTENVTLEAGSNVSITLGDSTIVISASGAGSPWEIIGNDIYYDTGNVGIGTTTPAHALQVVSDEERAIFGENTATSGAAYGVYGKTTGTAGRGLCGIATSSSGNTYGVYARNYSISGRAVYGNASASSGYTHGVSGQSWSSTGRGVNGLASAASGINYGVYGETYSPDGFAGYFTGGKSYFQGNVGIGMPSPAAKLHIGGTPDVDGIMFPDGTLQTTAVTSGGGLWTASGSDIYYDAGNVGIGTYNPEEPLHVVGDTQIDGNVGIGTTPSTLAAIDVGSYTDFGVRAVTAVAVEGAALYGNALATSGSSNGVRGTSSAPDGAGVFGTGPGTGVEGYTDSEDGIGVVGIHSNNSGAAPGVYGRTDATSLLAVGVKGEATSPYGSSAIGVMGLSHSLSGYGVYGKADNSNSQTMGGYFESTSPAGIGVYAVAYGADAYAGYFMGRGYFNSDVGIGTFSPGARLTVAGMARVDVLEIAGGSDLAENFSVTEPDAQPGMVVEIDPDNPGQLRVARGAYNRRVAGVISGAKQLDVGMLLADLPGAENSMPVALSGRVWVRCDATQRAIEPGDLLTTSARAGRAMSVRDFDRANGAVIGKAMSKLAQGETGLVLVLVNLQ